MAKRVFFLCTGNSIRSQMAEGLLRSLGGERFEVVSAGTHPSFLNPYAVRAMDELGIDISGQSSKSVSVFAREKFDYVITVCDNAKESCPVFSGKYKSIHWSFGDPAAVSGTDDVRLEAFRKVRDLINEKILEFLKRH